MNTKQKVAWVKALRSGRYKQGKNRLAGGGYYCCLGVAKQCFGLPRSLGGELLLANFLPMRVQEVLARKNDNGQTFAQIADYIEQKVRATK